MTCDAVSRALRVSACVVIVYVLVGVYVLVLHVHMQIYVLFFV